MRDTGSKMGEDCRESCILHPVSRIPYPASRIPHLVSRILYPASCIPHLASRIPHPLPWRHFFVAPRAQDVDTLAFAPQATDLDLTWPGPGRARRGPERNALACLRSEH